MFFKLLIKPQVPVWRKRRGRRPLLRALLTKRLEAQRKKSAALRVKEHVDKKVACTIFFIRIIIECCAEEKVP